MHCGALKCRPVHLSIYLLTNVDMLRRSTPGESTAEFLKTMTKMGWDLCVDGDGACSPDTYISTYTIATPLPLHDALCFLPHALSHVHVYNTCVQPKWGRTVYELKR